MPRTTSVMPSAMGSRSHMPTSTKTEDSRRGVEPTPRQKQSSTQAPQDQTEGHGMSKKPEKQQAKPKDTAVHAIEFPKDKSGKRIEAERFCPICWGRLRGYGTATNSTFMGKRYYKCDKTLPGSEFQSCGFTWSMEWSEILAARERFITEQQAVLVQHRPVIIDSTR